MGRHVWPVVALVTAMGWPGILAGDGGAAGTSGKVSGDDGTVSGGVEVSGDPAVLLAAYEQALDNARASIEQLRTELAETRRRAATLERALREAGIEPDTESLAERQRLADREAARQAEEERRRLVQEARERRLAERAEAERLRALEPAWFYTWQLGFIDAGSRSTTFVRTGDDGTVVFVGDRAQVDRRQVIVRGTWENKSAAPYRYTFEVRVGQSGGAQVVGLRPPPSVVSATRYQTPVLQPGELHRWEVTMSVDDALRVRRADVGNIRADAPPAAAVAPARATTPPDAPGPGDGDTPASDRARGNG